MLSIFPNPKPEDFLRPALALQWEHKDMLAQEPPALAPRRSPSHPRSVTPGRAEAAATTRTQRPVRRPQPRETAQDVPRAQSGQTPPPSLAPSQHGH